MNVQFSDEKLKEFHAIVKKYEVPRSALLPTLYLAQEQFGYLNEENMKYVARLLEMPEREVFEAVSFYSMFHKKDMGRWCLQVCQNITCHMMGSDRIAEVIKTELGVGPHEVTPDGLFSYVPVQCLGSCDTAPVVAINEDYVENLTADRFRELIRKLKGKPKDSLKELELT